MIVDTGSACRDIDAELVRKGAGHLAPVKLLATCDASSSAVRPRLAILPEGRRHPAMLDVEVDRERLPPGIVEKFVNRLLAPDDERAEFDADTDALVALVEPLAAILPVKPVVAQDVGSPLGRGRHSIVHETLDARLERTPHVVLRMSSRDANTISTIVEKEIRLAAKLQAAGSRLAALTCCPVAAEAITGDGPAWRQRLDDAVNGESVGIAFREGNYQPSIRLGPGFRWKGNSLDMESQLPDQLRSALPGQPLRALVGHPHVPSSIVIVDVFTRGNGDTVVRTDARPVPLSPLLDTLGIALRR